MSFLQFYQEKMASASCFSLFILAFFIPILYLLSILFFGNLYRSFLFPYAIGLLFVFFSFLLRYFYSLVSLGEFRSPKRYPFFLRDLSCPLFSEAFGFPTSPFPHHSLSCFFVSYLFFYASVLLYIEFFYLFI